MKPKRNLKFTEKWNENIHLKLPRSLVAYSIYKFSWHRIDYAGKLLERMQQSVFAFDAIIKSNDARIIRTFRLRSWSMLASQKRNLHTYIWHMIRYSTRVGQNNSWGWQHATGAFSFRIPNEFLEGQRNVKGR